MRNVVRIRDVIGVVILSVMSSFFIGGIIISMFSSSPNQTNKIYLYLSFLIGQIVIILPPIYYLNFKKKSIYDSLRFKPVSFDTLVNSVLLSISVIILFDALERIINKIVPTPDYIIDLGKIMQPDSAMGFIFLFLAVVIMAPIGEEMVFRGFLQKFLEEYWKDITRAILISSLIFAMIHFNPYWTIQIYLLGIILGFLSWKTKSIIPSIILHSLNNGIAFILTIFNDSNLNFYFWGDFISPIFIALAIYLLYYSINNFNQIKT